jgi:hypothetical protein
MTHRLFLALVLGILMASCESSPDYTALYRMEKPYWDADDYSNAIYKINATADGSKKPCYSDPATAPVFMRLANIENVSVIVEDEALGIKHRSEFAEAMFHHGGDMVDEYSTMNREDKFEYPMELVEVMKFHLYTQMHYFDLGNKNILQEADDPNEARVKNMIAGNEQTLVNNFVLYLDFVNDEKAFTPDALQGYIGVINEYFPPLIAKYPNASYAVMREKATDMQNKAQSPDLKKALGDLIGKIDANTAAIEAAKMPADSTATAK